VVVTRFVRESDEEGSEEGEMSVAQERGERDLKGLWWAISCSMAFLLPFWGPNSWMRKNKRKDRGDAGE
jgi:hypothetical protein